MIFFGRITDVTEIINLSVTINGIHVTENKIYSSTVWMRKMKRDLNEVPLESLHMSVFFSPLTKEREKLCVVYLSLCSFFPGKNRNKFLNNSSLTFFFLPSFCSSIQQATKRRFAGRTSTTVISTRGVAVDDEQERVERGHASFV